jgi:two-component system cell cycle sensor histidine kinase/response regulator CckA
MQTASEAASVIAALPSIDGPFGKAARLGKTILLIEAEAFVRKATAEVLESAGYGVVVARGAIEALAACRRCSQVIDLLLSDVEMLGMSGSELTAELNVLCPRAQVLLMSGSNDDLAVSQSSPHCKTYLGKPFSVPVLLRKVQEALGESLII